MIPDEQTWAFKKHADHIKLRAARKKGNRIVQLMLIAHHTNKKYEHPTPEKCAPNVLAGDKGFLSAMELKVVHPLRNVRG